MGKINMPSQEPPVATSYRGHPTPGPPERVLSTCKILPHANTFQFPNVTSLPLALSAPQSYCTQRPTWTMAALQGGKASLLFPTPCRRQN